MNTRADHAPDHSIPPDDPETARQQTPPEKSSYESNRDVQRWLREQAAEDAHEPEFHPTFLAHQRDRFWVLSSLSRFYEDELITDVLRAVKSGKEATVYCCVAHPSTGAEYLAAKVYRPRMFRSLKNDVIYRENRAQLDGSGHERHGGRQRGDPRRTERGRAERVASWIAYEYQTQRLLYDAGADVPKPVAQEGNALLMEYVGEGEEPAPLLREVTLDGDEAQPLFERVLRNIELFLACDRIHGDLSAYNLLYRPEAAVIIDFAQTVDPRYNLRVYDLLARDVERVCRHFKRYGIQADAASLAGELWERYLDGDLY